MIARRLAAFGIFALGAWLGYRGLDAVFLIMNRGSDLASALFAPPTSIIRLVATAFMTLGGVMALANLRWGGTVAFIGAVLFTLLGGLMALSGADQGLWIDEVLYGVGAIGIGVLILTLARN
jgi:hypothetical protein